MQVLVVGWTLWEITRDPLILGLVGLAEAIPAIGAALPMGYLVDRLEKRRVLWFSTLLIVASAICTGVLVQRSSISVVGAELTTTLVLAFVVVNGFARSMYSPAMFTALSRVVPAEYLPKATAIASTSWQGAMVAGPLAGGLVYGQFGVFAASLTTVVCMIAGAVALIWLPRMEAVVHHERKSLRSDVTMGLKFILGNQVIVGALVLDMLAVLFGGAVALLPAFASDVLHVDASGLGLLRAAPSIGSVVMMAWLSVHPPVKHTGKLLLFAVGGFGLATMGFALSTTFLVSVILLVVVGAFDGVSVVIRHTILQVYTPDHMRGRVAAANTMFISSSNELGALESGIAAKLLGLVPSVLFGAMVTLGVTSVVGIKAPKLRSLSLEKPTEV